MDAVFFLSSESFDTSACSSGPASPARSPVPDVDYTAPDTGSIKEVGFYLLRKDSERRATLVRVMTEDQDAVSDDDDIRWFISTFVDFVYLSSLLCCSGGQRRSWKTPR